MPGSPCSQPGGLTAPKTPAGREGLSEGAQGMQPKCAHPLKTLNFSLGIDAASALTAQFGVNGLGLITSFAVCGLPNLSRSQSAHLENGAIASRLSGLSAGLSAGK